MLKLLPPKCTQISQNLYLTHCLRWFILKKYLKKKKSWVWLVVLNMCTNVLLIGHDEYSRGACGRTYLLEGLSHPYTNKSGVGARVVPLKSPRQGETSQHIPLYAYWRDDWPIVIVLYRASCIQKDDQMTNGIIANTTSMCGIQWSLVMGWK